jgi:hypothetical protein
VTPESSVVVPFSRTDITALTVYPSSIQYGAELRLYSLNIPPAIRNSDNIIVEIFLLPKMFNDLSTDLLIISLDLDGESLDNSVL